MTKEKSNFRTFIVLEIYNTDAQRLCLKNALISELFLPGRAESVIFLCGEASRLSRSQKVSKIRARQHGMGQIMGTSHDHWNGILVPLEIEI